jgi:hypothetical protein
MQEGLEHTIRERAYHLWVANGCAGEAEHHWLAAERELIGHAAITIATPSEAAPARRRAVKAKSASAKKAAKAA